MEIRFLNLDEVLRIHADQVRRYRGSGQIRDKGLLESAVAMPRAGFGGQYAHPDLFEMAAAYLYHIVMNHPFLDGNKRTGIVCALAFLQWNGIRVQIDNPSLVEFVLAVAQGQKNKHQIARFLKQHSGSQD
ncbi:MAG: type II toxin-antitoxin system death-on-curing family toxin [Anaerohalosphaeraceae bacterium]|nr:type II toxin-antitoxin system death-on-curing family toxin [Anaerohalosphaeraceae bacterium]